MGSTSYIDGVGQRSRDFASMCLSRAFELCQRRRRSTDFGVRMFRMNSNGWTSLGTSGIGTARSSSPIALDGPSIHRRLWVRWGRFCPPSVRGTAIFSDQGWEPSIDVQNGNRSVIACLCLLPEYLRFRWHIARIVAKPWPNHPSSPSISSIDPPLTSNKSEDATTVPEDSALAPRSSRDGKHLHRVDRPSNAVAAAVPACLRALPSATAVPSRIQISRLVPSFAAHLRSPAHTPGVRDQFASFLSLAAPNAGILPPRVAASKSITLGVLPVPSPGWPGVALAIHVRAHLPADSGTPILPRESVPHCYAARWSCLVALALALAVPTTSAGATKHAASRARRPVRHTPERSISHPHRATQPGARIFGGLARVALNIYSLHCVPRLRSDGAETVWLLRAPYTLCTLGPAFSVAPGLRVQSRIRRAR
ncbi:hypothetical protein C8Q77DRAFT_116500 [Trametes polyzona]|nr:hypothetical protein C8Q77DRAFT_116500 [Trametes polyzona]